jgi:hypothetical protein
MAGPYGWSQPGNQIVVGQEPADSGCYDALSQSPPPGMKHGHAHSLTIAQENRQTIRHQDYTWQFLSVRIRCIGEPLPLLIRTDGRYPMHLVKPGWLALKIEALA